MHIYFLLIRPVQINKWNYIILLLKQIINGTILLLKYQFLLIFVYFKIGNGH